MAHLDPRTRLWTTLVFGVLVVLTPGWVGLAPFAAAALAAVAVARPGPAAVRRAVVPVTGLMALTVALQVGEAWWSGRPPGPALDAGALGAARLVFLALESAALVLTADAATLCRAAGRILAPLRRLGLPADDIGLMAGMALGLLPLLGEEAERIRRAQAARGATRAARTLAGRWTVLPALLVPLLVSAFRRADTLAAAMLARGYGLPGATDWRPSRPGWADAVVALALAALAAWVGLRAAHAG